jgi:hypothetical protein
VIEYGAAQCPTSTTVVKIGTPTGQAALAGITPKKADVIRGSAASSKAAIAAAHPPRRVPSGTTTTTETSICTIANTAAAAAAEATTGSIPPTEIKEPLKETTLAAAPAATTPTSGAARTTWVMAIAPNASTIAAPTKPSLTIANRTSTVVAKRKSSAAAPSYRRKIMAVEWLAFASVAPRPAAAPAARGATVTAVSRHTSPTSGVSTTTTTVAANCSIILKGAVFDDKLTRSGDINRATCAQAAPATALTAISPLCLEVFDVNILER